MSVKNLYKSCRIKNPKIRAKVRKHLKHINHQYVGPIIEDVWPVKKEEKKPIKFELLKEI